MRKGSKAVLVAAIVLTNLFSIMVIALWYYGYFGFNMDDRVSGGIRIQSYNATRQGSGFNLTLAVMNEGKGNETFGYVIIEPALLPLPTSWITLGNYSDITIGKDQAIILSFNVTEDIVAKTGATPHLKVGNNHWFFDMPISLPGGEALVAKELAFKVESCNVTSADLGINVTLNIRNQRTAGILSPENGDVIKIRYEQTPNNFSGLTVYMGKHDLLFNEHPYNWTKVCKFDYLDPVGPTKLLTVSFPIPEDTVRSLMDSNKTWALMKVVDADGGFWHEVVDLGVGQVTLYG